MFGQVVKRTCAPWYDGFRLTRLEILSSSLLPSIVDILQALLYGGKRVDFSAYDLSPRFSLFNEKAIIELTSFSLSVRFLYFCDRGDVLRRMARGSIPTSAVRRRSARASVALHLFCWCSWCYSVHCRSVGVGVLPCSPFLLALPLLGRSQSFSAAVVPSFVCRRLLSRR